MTCVARLIVELAAVRIVFCVAVHAGPAKPDPEPWSHARPGRHHAGRTRTRIRMAGHARNCHVNPLEAEPALGVVAPDVESRRIPFFLRVAAVACASSG